MKPVVDPASVTIAATSLSKRHEERVVLHRIGFSWAGPGIVCVRGPNGSGKTTLLSLLGGAADPDEGDVLVMGHSLATSREQALARVSFVPDGCPVYPFVSGREWLAFVHSVRRPATWLAPGLATAFGLDAHMDTRFGTMSLGTARKFLLAAGLGGDAPLVVLDEPTNGLDSGSLTVLRERLSEIAAAGLVVMCCHDLEQQRLLGARCVELAALEIA